MEPSLLMWGLCTALVVPGCLTELCDSDPPHVRHAAFKAFAYKKGTMLNCDCKEGFRRIKYGSSYITCAENSSWDNRCQCVNTSNNVPRQQSTPQPEERKDRKTTEMQGPMQPLDEMNLKDHCREPPFWEHEGQRRIYHFVVGQVVHYQCMQGYRALQRSPATSTCRMICGKTRWSQPRLTCVNEDEPSPFPGEEDPQASTDELPETETPCLSPTTDFHSSTEAVTMTMETLIFTRDYQLAAFLTCPVAGSSGAPMSGLSLLTVAGCVFLLVSILLSGLTWRWRRKKSRRAI